MISNNSSSKSARKAQNENNSASSETGSTNSSASVSTEKTIQLRIDDVPIIDLSKVEFLEKLGEGKILYF